MSRPRLIAARLALATLLVFAPVGSFQFVNYDDPDYVTGNPIVQTGLTLAGIQWAFTTGCANNWHPLTWLSHMTDCELFKLNAGAQGKLNFRPPPADGFRRARSALAETGDFSNAVVCAQNALDLATTAKMNNLERLRRRLELYQIHQPWRENFRATNAPAKN